MCGILGTINTSSENLLKEALKQLGHRGPDDSGVIWYPDLNSGLAQTRLSIIDLSPSGHQPMSSSDGRVSIVYNGEVYNFKELRDKYLSDVQFHSQTDTEVVLQLYIKFGISFIEKLNGDFAFAIFDRRKNKVFLARDHFGVKPLYYYYNGASLVFSSEIKGILSLGIKPELDLNNIENYLVFKYSPKSQTLFRDIKRLQPAHYLSFDIKSANLEIKRYWQVSKIQLSNNYSEIKEELYHLLESSVKMRLMSDVPVGTFFSGGIDSSIIAGYLKDNKNITHYTARKESKDLKKEGTTSDFEFAQLLAKKWDLNMVPIDIGTDEANEELISKTLFYSDDLIADGSQIPSYLITKEATKTSTVILSGMGADELFCGYKGHIMTLLSQKFDSFPNILSKPLGLFFSNVNPGKGRFKAYKRHLKQFGRYSEGYANLKYALFSIVGDYENAISILNKPANTSIPVFNEYFNNSKDPFDNLFLFELDNFLVKNLHYTDRMCMANAMEGRVPFLDKRIADFAYSLPRKYKIADNLTTKKILKDTYKSILPDDLINRRKAGFGMPLRSILSDYEKSTKLIDLDFFNNFSAFNVEQIKKIINNHINGNEDNSALLYALISFRLWYLKWIN